MIRRATLVMKKRRKYSVTMVLSKKTKYKYKWWNVEIGELKT